MAGPATDVFLSYKAEDRARLRPLVAALEAEGFTVWWDQHIGGGANWHEVIEQHLDAARCVLVAWSKGSVAPGGQFVRDEARRAQRRGVYVPLLLDAIEPPLGFGEIQALSLRGWKGDRSDQRFQAIANTVRSVLSGEPLPHVDLPLRQPRVSRRALIGGGAGAAAVAAAGGWFLLTPKTASTDRIAVLPFANLSGARDQAYFAEGIAEELRLALSRIGLQVIGRASSEAVKDLDTRRAAAKLRVANMLTGSVRRSPRMVRVTAQLLRGSDAVERWSQSYDRSPGDEIKIQTDIAASVADALSVALGKAGRAALTLGGTADPAAQDLFLRARSLYFATADRDSSLESLALVDAAITRDPRYAEAFQLKALILLALAGNYAVDLADGANKLAQAETAAKRAVALEPRLGSAHAALAQVDADRFDFPGALQNLRRALALSPQDLMVIRMASVFMQYFGNAGKALELADRALGLDPLDISNNIRRADVLLFALRDYPQSIVASRKALELAPRNELARAYISMCLLLMNRFAEARAELEKLPADYPLRLVGEALVAARSRDRPGAERMIAHLRELFGDTASYQYADIYAQAGDADRAFAELDNAVRVKDAGLQSLKSDPFLDPIARDPRFAALLKRLNFPIWN